MDTNDLAINIRPLTGQTNTSNIVLLLSAVATIIWLFYCLQLLTQGHSIFGTSSYGSSWGLSIAFIIHVIGISHIGIAVSATVRLLDLDDYRNLARLAEWVTIIALVTVVIQIGLDAGRPGRFASLYPMLFGRWHAPIVWSMTMIFLYFSLSSVYLYLSLRSDLWRLAAMDLPFKRLYRWLALGYQDTREQRARHKTVLYWLALILLPVMIAVHSVYGFFFGVLPIRPGWTNPLQAPYFVLGAIVSGLSAIVVIAAILRWAYAWKDQLPDRLFSKLGGLLALFVFLYLYFIFSKHFTFQYSTLSAEKSASSALLFGRFSSQFWATILLGLLIPFAYLLAQGVSRSRVHVGWTATAALFINGALLWKRYLFVIPTQFLPQLPTARPLVDYVPTLAEWIVTLGGVAFAIVLFLGFLRLIPVLPLNVTSHAVDRPVRQSPMRSSVMWFTWTMGILLISWGFFDRNFDYAPLKWLIGLALLVTIPLEHCLINDPPDRQAEEEVK